MVSRADVPAALRPEYVDCERLIYTWAKDNLNGSGGLGVLAHSRRWPAELGRGSEKLEKLVHFLPQGVTQLLRKGLLAPRCLAVARPFPNGGLLIAGKGYLGEDGMGRPGNYLVHALWDPTGEVTSMNGLGLWDSHEFWRGLPLPAPTSDLEPFRVGLRGPALQPVAVAAQHMAPLLEGALAALRPSARRPLVIRARSSEEGVTSVQFVLEHLPKALARRVTFSSFEANPAGTDYDIVITLPHFSSDRIPSNCNLVDLLSGKASLQDRDHAEGQIALQIVAQRWAESSSYLAVPNRDELLTWARSRELITYEPSTLTTADLTIMLSSDLSTRWLRQPAAQRHVVQMAATLALLHDGSVYLQALLDVEPATAAAIGGLLVQEYVRVLLTDRGRDTPAAWLHHWVSAFRHDEHSIDKWTLHTARLLTARNEFIHATIVWSALERLAPELSVEAVRCWGETPFMASQVLSSWGRFTERLIREIVHGPVELRNVTLLKGVYQTFPRECAAVFEALLAETANDLLDRHQTSVRPEEDLEKALSKWTLDRNPDLVAPTVWILCHVRNLPQGYLAKIVGSKLSPHDQHAIMSAHWPSIAAQAGIPHSLIDLTVIPAKRTPIAHRRDREDLLPTPALSLGGLLSRFRPSR